MPESPLFGEITYKVHNFRNILIQLRFCSTCEIIQLDVGQNTTVRECRHQLALRKGPWGDDPRWLFGGKLLENGRTMGFYGIEPKNTMDIFLSKHISKHGVYFIIVIRENRPTTLPRL